MSEENVQRVRQAVENINRGDLEAAFARAHPDLEWQTLDVFPDAETYHGPEGAREFFQTWRETFRGLRMHLEDCVPLDEHRVIAALRVSGRGTESGVEVQSPTFFSLLEFRDDQLIGGQMFATKSEALEAAGLGE
jgi:ketosteroid isomerase-like protein